MMRETTTPVSAGLDARAVELLFATTSDAAFVDCGGVIVAVNRAGADLYGTTVEALIGVDTALLVPEDYRPRIVERVERLRQGLERDRWAEEEILRADGSRRDVVVRSNPITFDGEPAALVLIRDVSEHRHVEKQLARRNEIQRVFSEVAFALAMADEDELDDVITANLGVIGRAGGVDRTSVTLYHDNGRISCAYEWVADGIERQIDDLQDMAMAGFEWSGSRLLRGEPVHVPDLDLLPPEAANEYESFARWDVRSWLVVPLMVGGRAIGDVGFNAVRRHVTWTEHEIDLLLNVAGMIAMSLTRRSAARESRAARDAAVEANAAKDLFLSRMSHELRTPLNAVLGFTELLLRQPRPPADAMMLEQVQSGGRHLLRLVEDVLDISRIAAGRVSVMMAAVPIDEAVAAAVDMAVRAHDGAAPRIDVATSGAMVMADPARLRQVLLNLLSNAIKYNRDGAPVEVRIEAGEQVRISVVDHGIGIAADLIPRVFEPFDRLGRETTSIEGIGIGLAVTRSLVELMGGTIEVESVEGEGSTFRVALHAIADTARPSAPARPSSQPLRSTSTDEGDVVAAR